ncbi:MAG: sigma-B regulation protein RsbU (phosphoserine phosphatase) [Verrucomicrobia bacterium]|nr:MAG: sigma-B regulation protein RsbU (phosphoserine phosphatase) [Verrucomicrobiota bacterium]
MRILLLQKAREKVVTEEARVFDFLHGLGEALSGTARPADLHTLIVKGLLRILRSQSGAIYLANDSGSEMHPAYVSKGCPALMELPNEGHVEEEAIHRQLRIRRVKKGDGVLAEVWQSEKAQVLGSKDPRLVPARRNGGISGNVAVAPLLYSGRSFGVLILARAPVDEPFTTSDMQVFQTLAEQSAFTLRTAEVFSDAAEKRRLDSDLQVAQEIQRILLPSKAPDFDGFEIVGSNVPARHVSGDYYDFLHVDPERCGVVIADVSGKGVPASLIMATCRSVLRSQAPGEISAAQVLKNVNQRLFPDIKEDMFISMAYMVLERNSPKITLCRAGHDAPFLYRAADRSVSRINPPGMAVGIDSGEAFDRFTRDFCLELHPNDCLVLYTDGVTEALDTEGEEFGMERVTHAIVESAPLGAAAILERLTEDLKKFVGAAPQHDDITLIVIRKK